MNEFIKMKMPTEDIGRALAYSQDEDQAAVINSLATELRVLCGSDFNQEMQLCSMSAHLNSDAKKLVASLHGFITNRQETT